MAEDPVVNLLRQHFKRVNECLQDKKNFDILTRFRFKSTCDKSIDDTDFESDDEYLNPEFELSQRKPGKSFTVALRQIPDTSVEAIESEEFQAETDFEEYSTEKRTKTEASLSLCNTTYDEAEENDENYDQNQMMLHRTLPRKPLSERPQTPMLEIYDSEDESEYYDTTPRKMEGSQKFILYPEQFQAGDLNFPMKAEELSEEKNMERPEILEILPRKEEVEAKYNIPSAEENERAFHKELELYKRDIKLEKTIKSLSYNDTNFRNHTVQAQPPSASYNQYPKNVNYSRTGKQHDFNVDDSIALNVARKQTPEYLSNYFEKAKTNVCRKDSQHEQEKGQFFNCDTPRPGSPVDNEILEFVYEKILRNSSTNGEGVRSSYNEDTISESDYLPVNHLVIQKEMMKRIEDMYHPGDNK